MMTGRMSFTLIELLVVVAIIAVLVSVLLPAVQQARIQGYRITCMHNLKSTHLAFQMYLNDHDQTYPPGYITSTGWNWSQYLFGHGGSPQYIPRKTQSEKMSVVVCPTQRGANWTSYGANLYALEVRSHEWQVKWLREDDPRTQPPDRIVAIYCHSNGMCVGAPNIWNQWNIRHKDVHHGGYPLLWFAGNVTFGTEAQMWNKRNWDASQR